MNQWKNHKLTVLGIENTSELDSSISHYCHKEGGKCSDFTNGQHNYRNGSWRHTGSQWRYVCNPPKNS